MRKEEYQEKIKQSAFFNQLPADTQKIFLSASEETQWTKNLDMMNKGDNDLLKEKNTLIAGVSNFVTEADRDLKKEARRQTNSYENDLHEQEMIIQEKIINS